MGIGLERQHGDGLSADHFDGGRHGLIARKERGTLQKAAGEMLSPDAYVCRRRLPGCLWLELGLAGFVTSSKQRKREY